MQVNRVEMLWFKRVILRYLKEIEAMETEVVDLEELE
jgi:hypothetical protein